MSTKETIEAREADCQSAADFAGLAVGFKALFEDGGKVSELMEQAAEFAMSGEENLDLARGYWDLLADKAKAVDAYGKALPEINDKGQLLEIGGFVASQVQDADLAKRFYAKAEEKMSAAAERIKLAEAVIRDTGDRPTRRHRAWQADDECGGSGSAVCIRCPDHQALVGE